MVSYVTQWSLSMSEIEQGKEEASLERYAHGLIRGGIPALGQRSSEWHASMEEAVDRGHEEYWDTLIRGDYAPHLRPASRKAFERFLLHVALDSGRAIHYTRWAHGAGVTTNTARVWWRMLMLSGLAYITPSISGRSDIRATKAPRGYLSDTGLLAGLLGIRHLEDALTGRYADRLLLTHVGGELMRLASDAGEASTDEGAALYHWQPAQRTGIDFIFESEGLIYSVICTTAAEPTQAQVRAVERFTAGLPSGSRGPALAVCYREGMGQRQGIQLLPAPHLRRIAQ